MNYLPIDIVDRLFGKGAMRQVVENINREVSRMGLFTEETEEQVVKLSEGDTEPFSSIEELLRQRNGWKESAAHFHQGMEYYRGLLDQIGAIIGEPAHIQDDGGQSDSVLRAKLPELVKEMKERLDGIP